VYDRFYFRARNRKAYPMKKKLRQKCPGQTISFKGVVLLVVIVVIGKEKAI